MRNCRMQNTEGKTMVIGPQFRPRDRSYCAVYRTPHVASAVVNCVTQMQKVAFCACYWNLPFVVKCVHLKTIEK